MLSYNVIIFMCLSTFCIVVIIMKKTHLSDRTLCIFLWNCFLIKKTSDRPRFLNVERLKSLRQLRIIE